MQPSNINVTRGDAILMGTATVLIIAGLIIGLGFFLWHTQVFLTLVCTITLPFLPFYILYRQSKNTDRLAERFKIEDTIKESVEELDYLVSEIETYDSKKSNESPLEYLDTVRENINSVANSLNDLV